MKSLKLMMMVVLISCFSLSSSSSYAQRVVVRSRVPARAVVVKYPKVTTVRKMPSASVAIRHNNISFHVSGGRYYRNVRGKFFLTMPPIGLRVTTLPSSRVSFMYKRRLYFCSAGVIYIECEDGGYEVASPEVGMVVPELPEVGIRELSIDDKIYYEYDEILYKPIPTEDGIQYEVVGELSD